MDTSALCEMCEHYKTHLLDRRAFPDQIFLAFHGYVLHSQHLWLGVQESSPGLQHSLAGRRTNFSS